VILWLLCPSRSCRSSKLTPAARRRFAQRVLEVVYPHVDEAPRHRDPELLRVDLRRVPPGPLPAAVVEPVERLQGRGCSPRPSAAAWETLNTSSGCLGGSRSTGPRARAPGRRARSSACARIPSDIALPHPGTRSHHLPLLAAASLILQEDAGQPRGILAPPGPGVLLMWWGYDLAAR
jgi:hypothetical protein